jgi:hypothetical protein
MILLLPLVGVELFVKLAGEPTQAENVGNAGSGLGRIVIVLVLI